MKRVLVLGSGFVARPLIRHLLDRGHNLVVATLLVDRAKEMVAGHANGKVLRLNVQDEVKLASFIGECDLAVSLLPFTYHPPVARLCIAHRKHMVTTSYVSAAMQDLAESAQAAGVTVLNEIGVDPGIDHMTAMRVIDDAHRRGGRIIAFRSYCGGLPAREANDNPFGYKFSWAPRGVLLAGRNSARYLLDGRRVDVPAPRLFRDMHILEVAGLGDFEAHPNRDSIGYADIYGLSGIQTIYRATLRNMGWCDCLHNMGLLGLLDLGEVDVAGQTYAEFMGNLAGCSASGDVRAAVAAKLGIPRGSLPIMNMDWLGCFSARQLIMKRIAPLDALGELMFEKLAFRPGERDMIVLCHDFRIEFQDGRREHTVSRLVAFGIPHGDSAMSRTVSLPAAISADLILTGRIQSRGVLRPVTPEIFRPVLDELTGLGIVCRETTEVY
jgi:saccharopine dehydrogenase-like NADP-dependent oxidoreductase